MFSIKQLQDLINSNLEENKFTLQPEELYEPINYVLSNGGKRIRPVLVLMACNLFNESINPALNAALGVEIFHNFTLLHDDIMDHAEIRRNKPTVHIKWDENSAILSGDAMLIKAYEFISGSHPDKLQDILSVFNQIALQVCEGQQYDMNFETRDKVSIEEYLTMIKLKTAVLIAGSLKIGAILGGATGQDAESLYQFGKNIGMAFQIQDDLLDSFGNLEKFGKKIGGDIVENKKTYLLIKAVEVAKGENLSLLNKYMNSNENFSDEEKISGVLSIYEKLNIKRITEEKIDEYFELADTWLNRITIEEKRKEKLIGLAENLINRSY
ncbi:polyprenyl synthetase family protein [Bacteroidota bacterium]